MKIIKNFREFVGEGIVKKQAPDISRANFLSNESEKSYLFVTKLVKAFGFSDENANSIIKLCYDIIMELIRADMLKKGFNASGKGAHEAEVSYLKELNFPEHELEFADQLRYFRNSATYYGKVLDGEYAEQVYTFMKKVYPKLKNVNGK